MDAREVITVGMSAERTLIVTPDRTVKHFVPKMPAVYATPMMIMEMEMASADAIAPHLARAGSPSAPKSISAISEQVRSAQRCGPRRG